MLNKKNLKLSVVALLSILVLDCSSKKEKRFKLLSATKTGIDFKNKLVNTVEWNALNYLYFYIGAGVTSADFNNDGLEDLYFTANMSADKLYINKGDLKFENTTELSGITNASGWTSGVTNVDINNDGMLDIYISKLGKHKHMIGENKLYVNQGNDKNGIPIFKEEAEKYGLNVAGFSNQATFFDYDLDGDLDLFLLHYSVYPKRTYGKAKKRFTRDSLAGDKFFINDNGVFKDISETSGIYSSVIGYGLGVAVSDINNDGYPDLYVGNDFFENDYLYINQKDGTFKDLISSNFKKFGHTTNFSMGNDIADFNNDGLMDILSLDMLADDLISYKTSESDVSYQSYQQFLKNGYHPQFIRNTLQLNTNNLNFSDLSFQSGVAATEWSWSGLFADFDNDGYKDIYVTNGIYGATNDKDFVNFISNGIIQNKISTTMSNNDLSLVDRLPKKHTSNYFFRNIDGLTFENATDTWFEKKPSFSNGAVYTDLDNDGDLDIVTNNVNEPAMLLENKTIKDSTSNYIKLKFKGSYKNKFGIGAKIKLYGKNRTITQENYVSRGYISGVSPQIHVGLGNISILDSLVVIWPNKSFQTLKTVVSNQILELDYKNASGNYYTLKDSIPKTKNYLENTPLTIDYKHQEDRYNEFNNEPLIPFVTTHQGPEITVADINADGLEDFFVGNSKNKPSALYIQNKKGMFSKANTDIIDTYSASENTDNIFVDTDNDGDKDLIIVNGGNQPGLDKAYRQVLYFMNKNGVFENNTSNFKNIYTNASTIKAVDFDNDGDQDLSLTSNSVPGQFGVNPQSYLFENDSKGNFKDVTNTLAPDFKFFGNIQDVVWKDINGNGFKDMIIAGFWMPISIFINDGTSLRLQTNNDLKQYNGFWNTIQVHDFDNDGDLDIIAGNWGLNSQFKASNKEPITLRLNDYDNNNKIDPIITHFYRGTETVFNDKDEITKQIPLINKKHLSYLNFAKANYRTLFPKEKWDSAINKTVTELASCYFVNNNDGTFTKKQLPFLSQMSSIQAFYVDDYNNDNYLDVLLSGNTYELNTKLSRLDAFHGQLLINDTKGGFNIETNANFEIQGAVRDIEKININNTEHYLISINNDSIVMLKETK